MANQAQVLLAELSSLLASLVTKEVRELRFLHLLYVKLSCIFTMVPGCLEEWESPGTTAGGGRRRVALLGTIKVIGWLLSCLDHFY